MLEASTVHIYSGLENAWTGYEQLAGLQYACTKRAEIEILSCVHGYCMHKERWVCNGYCRALACSKKPTDVCVRYAVVVINSRNGH